MTEPLPMKYLMQTIEGVVVVELEGDPWGGWDTMRLKDSVAELAKLGERRFIIDLSQTSMVNSAGIGTLIASKEIIESAGGTVRLCGVSERTRRVMAISEVADLFESTETRDEALSEMKTMRLDLEAPGS